MNPSPARSLAIVLAALCITSCATAPAPKEAPGAEAAPRSCSGTDCSPLYRGVLWSMTSAERAAIYLEVYRLATERVLAKARDHAPGTWAVIMDADETVLDNGGLMRELAQRGKKVNPVDWLAWARRNEAGVLPGAAEFIAAVRANGGRVVIVTNRDELLCPGTRENLASRGLTVDAVLCSHLGQLDKNPRFASVEDGTADPALPPLTVLAWVGDNIGDFPRRSQASREPLADFGETLFVLPNPMYGSWEKNTFDSGIGSHEQ